MEWTFGSVFLTMLAVWFWVVYIWMFIFFFGDIFRRKDLNGWAKAGWIALIVVVPFIGVLIYLIVRPKTTASGERAADAYRWGFTEGSTLSAAEASEEIARAAQLRDQGAISEDEFQEIKRKAMAGT